MRHKRAIAAAAALTLTSLAAFGGGASTLTLRQQLMAIPMSIQLGGDTTRPLLASNAFSFPAANLLPGSIRAFSFGNRLFNTNWVEAPASVRTFDGLGPLFNRVSCSGCHTKDGRGSPPFAQVGPMDSMLFRISIPGTNSNGGPKPVPGYGDQLSERAINAVLPEGLANIAYVELLGQFGDGESYSLRKPTYSINQAGYGPLPANILISPRVAPHMIGLGLLEAVPFETLTSLADPEDEDSDGISGRPNLVWDTQTHSLKIGRFGWKAGQHDLQGQNAGAALGDIGLTTDIHPNENCGANQTTCAASTTGGTPEVKAEFLEKLTFYTSTLAVPAQRNSDNKQVIAGAKLFRDFECSSCHMPTLRTGAHNLSELSNQIIHPFTDLLLHDMGDELSDNRPDFEATGREWRTPPLWGLGLVQTVNGHENLLHDGRARGFAEAILWHGGEGEKSKEAFRNASKQDREALIAYLNSL